MRLFANIFSSQPQTISDSWFLPLKSSISRTSYCLVWILFPTYIVTSSHIIFFVGYCLFTCLVSLFLNKFLVTTIALQYLFLIFHFRPSMTICLAFYSLTTFLFHSIYIFLFLLLFVTANPMCILLLISVANMESLIKILTISSGYVI